MSKGMKGAVIGYGGAFNMGRAHLGWMQAAGIEPYAACDTDAKRLEVARTEFPGIRTYSSVEELLADEAVDLCVVILPHNLHARIAIQCAEAGKHVIVEKPMCLTVAEADAMIAAAKKAGVMLSVFHNRRWDGDYCAIRQAVQKGVLGEIFQIEAYAGGYGHPGTWWRAEKAVSGGVMFDWGAHFIDWILNLTSASVTGVNGIFQKRVWKDVTNEDYALATWRFSDGCAAQLEIGTISYAPKPRWRILGTRGALVDEGKEPFIIYTAVEGYQARLQVPYQKSDWGAYYRNIVAHLRSGEELAVKPEEARRVIAIMEAAERSALSGQTVAPDYS